MSSIRQIGTQTEKGLNQSSWSERLYRLPLKVETSCNHALVTLTTGYWYYDVLTLLNSVFASL